MKSHYTYKSDVLFILHKREMISQNEGDWNYAYSCNSSSGLSNSVRFINDMLTTAGLDSNVVEVVDNNCIDREVTKYRPKYVIIEALWVVPEKFDVLIPLHPGVQWFVRLHSELPFLANEGIATQWIAGYTKNYPTVKMAANSKRAVEAIEDLFGNPVVYMPNFYPITPATNSPRRPDVDVINVSCFGAIRPLKNQLLQASAALKFANDHDMKLRFHINATRKEGSGDSILKNLVNLFKVQPKHELVCHPWCDHDEFKKLIAREIDIGLQVSFTETYNIVAADHVVLNVPVVTSKEVAFTGCIFHADPTDVESVVDKMVVAWVGRSVALQRINYLMLQKNSSRARTIWKRLFSAPY